MCLRSPSLVDQFEWHAEAATGTVVIMHHLGLKLKVRARDPWDPRLVDHERGHSWKNDGNHSYSVVPTRPMTYTTDSPTGNTVDERYREDLSLKLRPRWKEDPLPSTEFLVSVSTLFGRQN